MSYVQIRPLCHATPLPCMTPLPCRSDPSAMPLKPAIRRAGRSGFNKKILVSDGEQKA
jgi:hypothetical protein